MAEEKSSKPFQGKPSKAPKLHGDEIIGDFEQDFVHGLEDIHNVMVHAVDKYRNKIFLDEKGDLEEKGGFIVQKKSDPECFLLDEQLPLAKQLVNIGLQKVYVSPSHQLKPWEHSFFIGTKCFDSIKSVMVVDRNSYVYRYTNAKTEDNKWITDKVDSLPPGFGKVFEKNLEPLGIKTEASYAKFLKFFDTFKGPHDAPNALETNYIKIMSAPTINKMIVEQGLILFHLAVTTVMAEVHRDNLLSLTTFAMLDGLKAGSYNLKELLLTGKNMPYITPKIYLPTAPDGAVAQLGIIHKCSPFGGAVSVGKITLSIDEESTKLSQSLLNLEVPQGISKSKIINVEASEVGFTHKSGADIKPTYSIYQYPELSKEGAVNIKESNVRLSESYLMTNWFMNLVKDECGIINNDKILQAITILISHEVKKEADIKEIQKEFEYICSDKFLKNAPGFKFAIRNSMNDLILTNVITEILTNHFKLETQAALKVNSNIWPTIVKELTGVLHLSVDDSTLRCLNNCITEYEADIVAPYEDIIMRDFYCGLLMCNKMDYIWG